MLTNVTAARFGRGLIYPKTISSFCFPKRQVVELHNGAKVRRPKCSFERSGNSIKAKLVAKVAISPLESKCDE